MIHLTLGEAALYMVAFLALGAAIGTVIQTWWNDYLRGTRDRRSLCEHRRARNTCLGSRWD